MDKRYKCSVELYIIMLIDIVCIMSQIKSNLFQGHFPRLKGKKIAKLLMRGQADYFFSASFYETTCGQRELET